MIDLVHLKNLSLRDIQEVVNKQKTGQVEIFVPKSTRQFFSDPASIAYDYAYAAYSGQLLSAIALDFTCEYPTAAQHKSFLFKVDVRDLADLAPVLLHLCALYGLTGDDDLEDEVSMEDVDGFLSGIENEAEVAACPALIAIYQEFIKEADGEGDETYGGTMRLV